MVKMALIGLLVPILGLAGCTGGGGEDLKAAVVENYAAGAMLLTSGV